MDRNRCTLPWKDSHEGEGTVGLSMQSPSMPSIPSEQPERLLILDDTSSRAATGKMHNTLETCVQPSYWTDHHVPQTNAPDISSTRAESVHTGSNMETDLGLAGANIGWSTWSIGARSQSLPSLSIPVIPTPPQTKVLEPSFEPRFCQSDLTGRNRSLLGCSCQGMAQTSAGRTSGAQETADFNTQQQIKSSCNHKEAWNVAHGSPSEAISSGVGSLELSAPAAATPFLHTPALNLVPSEVPGKVTGIAGWTASSEISGQCANSFWCPSTLNSAWPSGLNNALPLAIDPGQSRNPMWGVGDQGADSSAGDHWGILYNVGPEGYDHPASAEGTSSLSSSRSLPELSFSSGDPWLAGIDGGWMSESFGRHGPLLHRERCEDSQTVRGSADLTSFDASRTGPTPGYGTRLYDQTFERLSGSNAENSFGTSSTLLGRTRMEEGSIGSKRRVWYRASNGQFTSASQALTRQLSGDVDLGGSGVGDERGSEGIRRIRRRRKSEEVERKYRCDYDGCEKAYGTLNRRCNAS